MTRTLIALLLVLVPLSAGAAPVAQGPGQVNPMEVFDELVEEILAAEPGRSRAQVGRHVADSVGLLRPVSPPQPPPCPLVLPAAR
ncbi:MAG: hypothetical protein ACI8PZ_002505 [Myxococcota bacterium]|jgi:hypothetical protein